MKLLLHALISPEQSAFIQGCNIHDNILIAKNPLVLLKFDVEKAFV